MKVKNVIVNKNIDRLRMTIDEFKYKTSQILQYIDEEIRDLKMKEEAMKNSRKMEDQIYYDQEISIHNNSKIIDRNN